MARSLSIQKVMKIYGYDTTGKRVLSMKKLKESTFTNGQESVFVTSDNTKIASFDFGKNASIGAKSAVVQSDMLEAQTGAAATELTNTTLIRYRQIVTVASNTALTSYTATGTLNNEIKFAYVLNTDGSVKTVLTQGATAAAGVFAYATGTKTLTFSGQADGTKIEVEYYPTYATATKVANTVNTFSKTLAIECECLFKDACTDQYVVGILKSPKGKISGAFEWAMTEGGEPAVHDCMIDLLQDCTDGTMWEIYYADATTVV
jgi:hypothetical protein